MADVRIVVLDKNGSAVPTIRHRLSYQYIQDLVRKQWKTTENKTTDKDGGLNFRRFYGEYLLNYAIENIKRALPFRTDKTMYKAGQPITLYLRLNS